MELYGTCIDIGGVRGGTDQVLVCPEFKKHEGTPSKTDLSHNSQFKVRHGMSRVQICAFRKYLEICTNIFQQNILHITYIITLLIFPQQLYSIFRDNKNYTILKIGCYQINMPGCATVQAGVASFSLEKLTFSPTVGHLGLLINDLVLGQVFLSCQFFPIPLSFHTCIIIFYQGLIHKTDLSHTSLPQLKHKEKSM